MLQEEPGHRRSGVLEGRGEAHARIVSDRSGSGTQQKRFSLLRRARIQPPRLFWPQREACEPPQRPYAGKDTAARTRTARISQLNVITQEFVCLRRPPLSDPAAKVSRPPAPYACRPLGSRGTRAERFSPHRTPLRILTRNVRVRSRFRQRGRPSLPFIQSAPTCVFPAVGMFRCAAGWQVRCLPPPLSPRSQTAPRSPVTQSRADLRRLLHGKPSARIVTTGSAVPVLFQRRLEVAPPSRPAA